MAGAVRYQKILKYKAIAVCKEPLHIGSAVGDKEEVLVHPIDNVPFVQATSIAGVFRKYFKDAHSKKETEVLFGASKLKEDDNAYEYSSRLRFSDGVFLTDKDSSVLMELRPRVSINRETGAGTASEVKGTSNRAGHKFNMEYIGAGAKFAFTVYLYDESFQDGVEDIFSALQQNSIQFGGQKSNGCGLIELQSLKYKCFDMTEAADRRLWAEEEELGEEQYEEILPRLSAKALQSNAYEIIVLGKTESELLVKSAGVVADAGENPDSVNIRNAAKEYIVPGSSLKGAVRSRMEKIAAYLEQEQIIDDTFGDTGKVGNISFFDAVIGEKETNDLAEIRYRVHIDKFTGGVMTGSLFNEKNVSGKLAFRMTIADKNSPDKSCGLLLLALRDMAIGTMNVGSGYSVGKGIIDVSKILVKKPETEQQACIDFKGGTIENEEMISACILAAQGKEKEDAV